MKIYTHRRHHSDQPGFRETSTKKNARVSLKKATRPAPKRERKPIEFAGQGYIAQPKGTKGEKKSGKGKALRRAKHRLEVLKERNARPRSIKRLTKKVEHMS